MNVAGSKRCSKCGEMLPLHQFYSERKSKDGYRSACKRCLAQAQGKVYEGKRNKDLPIPEDFKRCSRCEQVLPKTQFFKSVDKSDGLQSWCKDCRYTTRERKNPPKEPVPEGLKRCYKCKQLLPATLEFFSAAKNTRDRLQAGCKQCFKAYREQNRHRILAQKHEHYVLNADKINAAKMRYYYARKEYFNSLDEENYREYKQHQLSYSRIAHARRRSRQLELPYNWNVTYWNLCLRYWDYRCCVCGEDQNLHADHWIPLSDPDCPGTIPENMIVLCRSCNVQKRNRLPRVWLPMKLGEEPAEKKLVDV